MGLFLILVGISDSFGHFLVTFSDASVIFSSLFCQTFAGLLLRQGEYCFGRETSLSSAANLWILRQALWVRFGTRITGWEEVTEFSPWNSVRAEKLTGFGVWSRALRNRTRPVSDMNSVKLKSGHSGKKATPARRDGISRMLLRSDLWQFALHFVAISLPNTTETPVKKEICTGENTKDSVEIAPRNCRFLSLVVVERVLSISTWKTIEQTTGS